MRAGPGVTPLATRWTIYACVAAAAAAGSPACGDNRLPAPDRVEILDVPAAPPRQLDLLLQIDDSNSSPESEVAIGDEIAGLFAVLATTDGGLPDLHVGVISSDLGASSTEHPELPPTLANNCRDVGRDGLLQTGQAGTALRDTAYVVDEAVSTGGRSTNYDGALTQVVTKMVKLGHQGCGFEQPLGAIRRGVAPGHNPGFRRDGANLAVIILADEDDCSILDPALLDPAVANLGPLASFRCTREGVACDQPITDVGIKTGCHSNEESSYVEPIALTRAALEEAAPSTAQVVLGAIIGDATPVAVQLRRPPGDGAPIPALSHSCMYETPYGNNVADPAVRIAELVDAFASRGVRRSVCTPPSSNQVRAIATAIKSSLGTVCLPQSLPTLDCEAHDTYADGSRSPIPACDASRTTDCFALVDDPVACAETPLHLRFVVHRSMPPPALTRTTLTCAK